MHSKAAFADKQRVRPLLLVFEAYRWQQIGSCQHQRLLLVILYIMLIASSRLLLAEFAFLILWQHEHGLVQ